MNALQEAADQVKNVGRTFRAVILLADAIEKIGSLDAAAAEAEARLSAARAGADKAAAELAAVLAEVSDAKGLALRIVQEAEDAGTRVRASAAQDVSAARAEASKVTGDLVLSRRAIEAQIAEAKSVLAGFSDKIDAKAAELEGLRKHVADVKAAALKALGA